MNRTNSPVFVAKKALKKNAFHKAGWLHINFSSWETEQLKALAECEGIAFRHFLEHALRHYRSTSESRLGITAREAVALTKNQRRQCAVKHDLINRAIKRPGKSPAN